MASKVYFTNLRTSPKQNLLAKLDLLMDRIEIQNVVPARGLTAIKLHFGEKGNLAYIRPNFLRQIVLRVKQLGALPFLTDANTLYAGTRSDSVSHLTTAIENGFAYAVVNAPLIIADGLRGGSTKAIQIDGELVKKAFIAKEIAEADALISVAHFKGHELSGFGGTIKNLGMGCAARQGKMEQHADLSPKITRKKCVGCGACTEHCAQSALTLQDAKAVMDVKKCIGCGECILICPNKAIDIQWSGDMARFQKKMVEYTYAVLKTKPGRCVFFNFLSAISPACDCYGYNDAPLVQDLGMMASLDPVAIDQAAVDMVNRQKALENSCLTSHQAGGEDKFRGVYPKIDWTIQLAHAEKIGLGQRDYELITV